MLARGFTTFFKGSACPAGWRAHVASRGRLAVSVSTDVGTTVGAALANKEDRSHAHSSCSGTVNVPSRGFQRGIDSNFNYARPGAYPVSSSVEQTTSGLAFAQLLMCTFVGSGDAYLVRRGTIGYFDETIAPSCPAGWAIDATLNGRLVVPRAGEVPLSTNGVAPLAAHGALGQHGHASSFTFSTQNKREADGDQSTNQVGNEMADSRVDVAAPDAGSQLPYIRLLTCVAQGTNTEGPHQMHPSALVFHDHACPSPWRPTALSGRLLASLPAGGEAGALFGSSTLLTPTASATHQHPATSFSFGFDTSQSREGFYPFGGENWIYMQAPGRTYSGSVTFSGALPIPAAFATQCEMGDITKTADTTQTQTGTHPSSHTDSVSDLVTLSSSETQTAISVTTSPSAVPTQTESASSSASHSLTGSITHATQSQSATFIVSLSRTSSATHATASMTSSPTSASFSTTRTYFSPSPTGSVTASPSPSSSTSRGTPTASRSLTPTTTLSLSPSLSLSRSATSVSLSRTRGSESVTTLSRSQTTSPTEDLALSPTATASRSATLDATQTVSESHTSVRSTTMSDSVSDNRTPTRKSQTASASAGSQATATATRSTSRGSETKTTATASLTVSPTEDLFQTPTATSSGAVTRVVSPTRSLTLAASLTKTLSTSESMSRSPPTMVTETESLSPSETTSMSSSQEVTATVSTSVVFTGGLQTEVPSTIAPTTAVSTTGEASTVEATTSQPAEPTAQSPPVFVSPSLPYQRSIVLGSVADRSVVTLQMQRPSAGAAVVHFQQAFTGAAFTPTVIGAASCEYLRRDAIDCFALNDCASLPSPANVTDAPLQWGGPNRLRRQQHHLHRHDVRRRQPDRRSTLTPAPQFIYGVPTPGSVTLGASEVAEGQPMASLRVVLGASTLANPSCRESIALTAAVLQSDAPFVTVPVYHPAAIDGAGLPSGAATTLHATISVKDAAGASRQQQLSLLASADAPSATAPELSRDGVESVLCTIPDVSSFDKTPINASASIGQQYSLDCSHARTSPTGADLQARCAGDEQCLGLTTAADGLPLCMLRAGRGVDPYQGTAGRWLLTKQATASRTCSSVAANSGSMAVLIQQTSLASTTVVVYVGAVVAAQCGGPRAFVGRQFGQSSRCGSWLTCFDGRVLANDTVRVVYSATASAGGCNGSVGVLFSARFDAADQTRAPEPRVPQQLSPDNVRAAFPHRLVVNVRRRAFVNVFAYNAEQVLLTVAQTGFDCSRTSLKACTRAGVQLSVQWVVAQECGGTRPFLGNVSGASDQCAQPRICGPPVELSPKGTARAVAVSGTGEGYVQLPDSALFAVNEESATATYASAGVVRSPGGYTGWLTLSVDTASIRAASSLCPAFTAVLRASSGQHRAAAQPVGLYSGFPLSSGSGAFALLAAPRVGTAVATASATWPDALGVPPLSAVLGQEDPRSCVLVNASRRVAAPAVFWAQVGGVNASFACIMDWISTDSGACVIPVPPGANFARIHVGQTNFASDESIMSVAQLTSESTELERTQCGGSLRFSGQPSQSEQCTTFLPCGSGYLASGAAYIRLSAPAAAGDSGTCAVAFAATVDFTFVAPAVAPVVCPFQCRGDRTCIALTGLCNGVVECEDGSDEETCNSWSTIEASSIFAVTSDTLVFRVKVFGDCRTAAIRNQTSVFAISRNQTVCILYHRSKVGEYLTNPTPHIVAAAGFSLVASLGGGVSYGRCTAESSCSGKGTVVEARSGGKLSCSCICSTGFTGSDCSQRMELSTVGPIAVAFSSVDGSVATPSEIEAALYQLSNSTELVITCQALIRDQAQLMTTCRVSGPASDVDAINAAVPTRGAQTKIASALNISADSLAPLTPSTQPLFQKAPCSGGGSGGSDSLTCPVGGKPVRNFQVSVTASAGVGEIVLSVNRSSGAQREFVTMSSLRCVPDNGNLYGTPTRNGCVTTVCFITSEDTTPVDSVSVSTGINASTAAQDPCYAVGLEFTVPVLISGVIKAHPVKSDADYSPFLIGCIVVMIVGGALMAVAAVVLRKYITDSAAAVGEVINDHALKSLLTTAIRKMKFNHTRNVQYEKWSTVLAIAAFNLLVLGTFLALYFANSSEYASNVQVLVEAYRTDACDRSTFAPLATRATIVPSATSRECQARESTGLSFGSVFAAAYCDNSTGSLSILVKIGSSLGDCQAMKFTTYAAGACVRTSDLLPHLLNATSYLMFQCGTVPSAAARFAAFQALNAEEPDTDVTRPEVLAADRAQPRLGRGSLGEHLALRVAQSSAVQVTSTAASRFETSAAGGDALAGDQSPRRLVVHVESEVFDTSARGLATAALEQSSPVRRVSAAVAALGPQDGDYPVGNLFNNFGLPGEVSLAAAGPAAARYYGVRGSLADIGQHFSGDDPYEGITITMYLRCTRRTEGFAFAVADGREDTVIGISPLLTRLMTMLANGSPATAWYNSTYNVYSGLFVDGPGMSLRFVHANAAARASLTDLQWDLAALGLTRLFNGLWHHVAIIIRNENEKTKVQLVVDGETSLSKKGWNQCPSAIPEPVRSLDPNAEVPVRNFQAERVVTEGVLYAGYFNGGVAHLQFDNSKASLFELWRGSTAAIRSHANFDESRYIALGSVLIVIGAAMIVAMVATSGREWRDTGAAIKVAAEEHSKELYSALWQEVPRDPQGVAYAPLPYEEAFDCLDCDVETFTVFVAELRHNFKDPAVQLVRLLYAKVAAVDADELITDKTPPTAAAWMAVMPQDSSSSDSDAADQEGEATDDRMPGGSAADARSAATLRRGSSERTTNVSTRVTSFSRKQSAAGVSTGKGEADGRRASRRFSSSRHSLMKNPLDASTDQSKADVLSGVAGQASRRRDAARSHAQKTKAKMGEAKPIRIMKITGAKVTSATGGGRRTSAKSGNPPAIIQSTLGVLQAVSMWSASFTFPDLHHRFFKSTFAVFSLEMSTLFSSPLVTPLVQLFAGLVIFGILFFVVEADEKAFLWNLARYLVKRDEMEFGTAAVQSSANKVNYMSEVDAEFDEMLGEVRDNGYAFSVPLMPLRSSRQIDDLVSGDPRRALGLARALWVKDDDGELYTLQKPPPSRDKLPVEELYCKSKEVATKPLRELGHRCVLHTDRLLAPQEQTSVWPYKYRPSCGASTHGQRCNTSVGLIFVCAHTEEDGETDATVQCKYALCEHHYRAPAHVSVLMPLLGLQRSILSRGTLWLVVTIVLVAANVLYMPFMKTALSILACDPTYQCQFPNCWEAPDRLFILAAYLCLVIVAFYGVGFPLTMSLLLRRRKSMLHEIFFSDVYGGHFEDPAEPGAIDGEEWSRYVVTDPTALGKLYLSYEFEWIYIPPILLAWKAASLLPAVFLERDTFVQAVGIAAVEFAFGVFLFATEASISPIVDFTYKFGAAHQMLFLGVLSLNTRQKYAGGTALDGVSIAVTMLYLIITGLIFVGTTAVPVVQNILRSKKVDEMFADFDMHYSRGTGLYVVPSAARTLYIKDAATLAAGPSAATACADEANAERVQKAIRVPAVTDSSPKIETTEETSAVVNFAEVDDDDAAMDGTAAVDFHPALAKSVPPDALAAASSIIAARGATVCLVTPDDDPANDAALVTAALHKALAAGVECPPRLTRTPAVLIVAATADAAAQIHQRALALLRTLGEDASEMPYRPSAALLKESTGLNEAAFQIIRDSGVSPVVISTFARMNALNAQLTVQLSKAVCFMLVGAHMEPARHEFKRLMERVPSGAQVVCMCPPNAWPNLENLFQEEAGGRGRLVRVLGPRADEERTHTQEHPPPSIEARAVETKRVSVVEEE